MLNQCNFIGRVGKPPETRYTPSGAAVANFSMAVSERFKDKNGEKQERTEWVNVVAWRNLAEIIGKYVTKGQLLFISGKLQTRSYDDRDGNRRYISEVVATEMQMLGPKGEAEGSGERAPQGQSRSEGTHSEPPFDPSDDVPF